VESSWLPFGILRRPHGTSGEIPLRPFNIEGALEIVPELPAPVQLVSGQEVTEATLVACRAVHGEFLVRFEGIETRESAAALAGRELHLPRDAFAPLDDTEFFVEDLVGCEAFLGDGQRVGRVTGTFWNGAHDVITIVRDDGSERLLPVVGEFISQFESASRRLVVDLHE
jgi:16S rRNA processing protein RimM